MIDRAMLALIRTLLMVAIIGTGVAIVRNCTDAAHDLVFGGGQTDASNTAER
jgi:hypothetical protein